MRDIFPLSREVSEEDVRLLRRVQLHFGYPPSIYGVYDTGDGVIYIFGEHNGETADVVSHEMLHWVVQKIAGKQASLNLDNIPRELLR
jgi:hypothetical protein